jgi:hypothetical protein
MNELIVVGAPTGSTIRAVVRRDSDELAFNVVTRAYEVLDVNAPSTDYLVELVEHPSLYWYGDLASDMGTGAKNVTYYLLANPPQVDWDTDEIIDIETIPASAQSTTTYAQSMIVTMPELREWLEGSPIYDRRNFQKLKAAIEMFERYTNRLWNYRTNYVEYYRPVYDNSFIYPALYPIDALAITEWVEGVTEAEGTLLDPSAYVTDLKNGVIRRLGGPLPYSGNTADYVPLDSYWLANVKTVITGGYTSGTCPPDVKDAIITQVRYSISRNNAQKLDVASSGGKGGSATFETDHLHRDFRAMARFYRRMV